MTAEVKKMSFSPTIALTYDCNANCNHCYPRGLNDIFPKHISLENFQKTISWFKKQGIKETFLLTGGEPTSHPQFKEILSICKKEKIQIGILTNCLFDETIMKELDKSFVSFLMINYFSPSSENFNHKHYNNNIEKIYKKNIRVNFFYKLPIKNSDQKDLIEKSKKYDAEICGHFIMPGFLGKKITTESRIKDMRSVLDIMDLVSKENVKFVLLDVLLRCAFSDSEWDKLRKFYKYSKIGHSRCYVGESYHVLTGKKSSYSMRITINPDLSIFPCFPVFFKGPSILSFNDVHELGSFLESFFEKWRWEVPLMKKCEKCEYYLKKECQGGCIHYKHHNKYGKEKELIKIADVI